MEPNFINTTGAFVVSTIVTGGDWRQNCFLVRSSETGEQVLIDPGGEAERVIALVEQAGGALRHVLLTHGHHDHVGAVEQVCQRFSLKCLVHEAEKKTLRQAPNMALAFAKKRIDAVKSFEVLDGSGSLPFANGQIKVIETGGHTPGGVSYDFGPCVFPGDTLLYQYVGRADLMGGNSEALTQSIDRLFSIVSPDAMLFAGHGRPWKVADARSWWEQSRGNAPAYVEPR